MDGLRKFMDELSERLEEKGLTRISEKIIDVTGAELKPGKPSECQGNGEHPGFEICCDNCDYFLDCFPNWKEELQND